MNEESIDNPNNITSNFKMLAKSISSAQSNIFRCKSTLKSIEDELIYLNANNNTNTNNREYKKPEESIDSAHMSNNLVEIDTELTKNDYFIKHLNPEIVGKSTKSRKLLSKTTVCQNQDSHNNAYNKNTNVCNISGELNNLMRAQQKLICQIEQLKCEIREKAGSIDMCLRDNQYFSCKFKEIESDIDHLKKDVDKIKKDLAQNSNRDRGFSPYSQESFRKDNMNIQPPIKNYNGRLSAGEMHYGYQDICTPDNSVINGPMVNRSSRNILLNVRDPQGNSRTFEDLMKKSKLDIDCNINNCRNNQNAVSLLYPNQSSPVLNDFANLTNQIRNLRKMAESIFKSHNYNEIKKSQSTNNAEELNISKYNDHNHEDHSKSSVSKPLVETTLSILNQSQFKQPNPANPINIIKRDTSSESASISGSDTSACLCTEDQFPIHSPLKNSRHSDKKVKDHDHFCAKDLQSNNFIPICLTKNKKHAKLIKHDKNENLIRKHNKCKDNDKNSKKQELCTNCVSLPFPCSKIRDICICQMKKQICHNRSVCAECHQYLPNFGN